MASSILWVMNIAVRRAALQTRNSSCCIRVRVCASRAANGSSSSRILGSLTSARAMRHTLAHAARQLLRITALETRTGRPKRSDRALARGAAALATPALAQSEFDVLLDGEPGKQRIFLENYAAVGAGLEDRLAVKAHVAAGRMVESGNDVEQRRLSATARAEDR